MFIPAVQQILPRKKFFYQRRYELESEALPPVPSVPDLDKIDSVRCDLTKVTLQSYWVIIVKEEGGQEEEEVVRGHTGSIAVLLHCPFQTATVSFEQFVCYNLQLTETPVWKGHTTKLHTQTHRHTQTGCNNFILSGHSAETYSVCTLRTAEVLTWTSRTSDRMVFHTSDSASLFEMSWSHKHTNKQQAQYKAFQPLISIKVRGVSMFEWLL